MHLHNTPDGGSTVTEARQYLRDVGVIAGTVAAPTCEEAMAPLFLAATGGEACNVGQ